MRRAILCLALVAGLAAREAPAANPFLEVLVSGANTPMYAVDRGDGTLFVVERGGLIRIANGGTLQAPSDAFLDISGQVDGEGEGGLLSMVLDPNFASNRRFFIAYTRTGTGGSPMETVIASYQTKLDDPNHADTGTVKEVLTQLSPVGGQYINHKGGTLLFSPVDHLLYYGLGDGGGAGDQNCNAQTGSTLLGKIIRIDPNGSDPKAGHPTYGIPADNPFAKATDGTRPEIWALGVRNPFRYSFDASNGDLWIGDVGQDLFEEIDRAGASQTPLNYGWKIWEADSCYAANPANESASPSACPAATTKCTNDQNGHAGYTFPVFNYKHDGGSKAIVGGYVYRGAATQWRGKYIFADFEENEIWVLRGSQRVVVSNAVNGPVAFSEDHTGELMVVGLGDGNVYRMHFEALGMPKIQARCVVKLNQDFAGLADFESSKIRSCIDQGARGKAPVGSCIGADPKGALAKRQAKIASDDTKLCVASPPDFGYGGAGSGSEAAVGSEQDLFDNVFGDPNSAIPLKTTDRNTVVCQESVTKALAACQHARRAEFLRCKAKGLADMSITSADELASNCLDAAPTSAITRACDGATGAIAMRVIPKACKKPGVDLSVAFPGCGTADPGTLAQCLDHTSQCETCLLFNDADALGTSCPCD